MVPGERELQGIRGDRGYDDTYLVCDRQLNIGELGGEGTFVVAHDPGDEIVEIVLTITAAQFPEETQLRTLAGLNAIGEDAAALAEAQASLVIPAAIDPSDFQPVDGTLTALAGLTIAADSLSIGTGADAFTQTTFAANTFPAKASTGSLVAKTITDFGLSFVDDADASAGRSTLGLGTLATQSGTFSGTSSGTNTGDQTISLTGDVTGSGTGSFAATIANAAVTLAKMADLAQDAFIVRTTASTGVPQTATCTAAARTVLDDATVAAMVDTLGGASSTGSGGLVRATSPTLVTPALGTPASGVLTNCTDPRFLEVTQRIRKDIQRWIHATTGSAGWWTTAASGSGTSWFVTQPQYVSEMRSAKVYHALSLWTGTTTTGTNARAAYPNSVGSSWLSDGLRIIWHGLLQTPTLFESARVGAWGNGATPTSTGRPAYGVWLEKDATTLGNSNWWLCAANGGAVSTTDTGIAADATERVWMIEFEGTSSLKIWELGTSTTTPRGSTITTNLPSGNTPRSFTPFLQIQRVITTAGQSSLITINCDFGVLLDDCGLLYENPA